MTPERVLAACLVVQALIFGWLALDEAWRASEIAEVRR